MFDSVLLKPRRAKQGVPFGENLYGSSTHISENSASVPSKFSQARYILQPATRPRNRVREMERGWSVRL